LGEATGLLRFSGNNGRKVVSIIRVGLGETKNFAEGYQAIFGKKKPARSKAEKKSSKGNKKAKAKKR